MRGSSQSAGNSFILMVDVLVGQIATTLLEVLRGCAPAGPARPRRGKSGRPRRRRRYHGGGWAAVRYTREVETMSFTVSRNPAAYRERKGLVETRRLPEARYAPGDSPVNNMPAAAPYPLPALVRPARRPGEPDSGPIQPWPGRS